MLKRLVYSYLCSPASRAEPYLRLDTLAGKQAPVDWGHFGQVRVGATPRSLSCFVLVLSWSRACYGGHVEAFTALQGVPRTILYDSLKSVVLERIGDHIRFHPRVIECPAPTTSPRSPARWQTSTRNRPAARGSVTAAPANAAR